MAKIEATTINDLFHIGQMMSNILFNLAQNDVFKKHHATMDSCRKQWDGAKAIFLSENQKTETFWLARDVYYNLSSNPMMLKDDYFFPTEKAKVFEYFSAETAKILGLPTLRKGQQRCFRSTPQGWEVVK